TSLLALAAHKARKPVIVLSEALKFSQHVQTDAFTFNEMAPADDVVRDSSEVGKAWRESDSLMLTNPLHDVVPPHHVSMILSDIGRIAPTSVAQLVGELHGDVV
ncbi:MAG: hypothetical protein MHM6MM_007189, partial [Cercozoa sp. M6MM]